MQADKKYRGLVFGWFLFDYTLPVFFIVVFWPIAAFLLRKSHPFDRVFHTADLIPLGSILLLSSLREIDTEHQLGRMEKQCEYRRILGLFIAVIFLFAYAIFRYYSFEISFPDTDDKPVDQIITAISYCSLAAIAFCGGYALWLKSAIFSDLRRRADK